MKKQKGQVLLALILIMTVALAIGLSVVQKSLVDVSTSTKVEQSSRAFSAAEAGIEHALRGGSTTSLPSLGSNNAQIKQIDVGMRIPCEPGSAGCAQADGDRQSALEYPPLAKEEVAHVWLAAFDSTSNPPTLFYKQTSLDIYWGNSAINKAALELTLVYYDGTLYQSKKWYLDHSITRSPANNFEQVPCSANHTIGTNTYQCKKTLSFTPQQAAGLMLIRVRLLYNEASQPFAVQATFPCQSGLTGNSCFIPPQAKILTSTGISGETQRRVQVFQIQKVVPTYFDYAIFSAGVIKK